MILYLLFASNKEDDQCESTEYILGIFGVKGQIHLITWSAAFSNFSII